MDRPRRRAIDCTGGDEVKYDRRIVCEIDTPERFYRAHTLAKKCRLVLVTPSESTIGPFYGIDVLVENYSGDEVWAPHGCIPSLAACELDKTIQYLFMDALAQEAMK